jgi:hypothetical protein
MLLNELFSYFNKDNLEDTDFLNYDHKLDQSNLKPTHTRMIRLCLGDICRARKAADFHDAEKLEELDTIRNMYKAPDAASI